MEDTEEVGDASAMPQEAMVVQVLLVHPFLFPWNGHSVDGFHLCVAHCNSKSNDEAEDLEKGSLFIYVFLCFS